MSLPSILIKSSGAFVTDTFADIYLQSADTSGVLSADAYNSSRLSAAVFTWTVPYFTRSP